MNEENAYREQTDREGEDADQEKDKERENVAEGVPDRGHAVLSIGGRH